MFFNTKKYAEEAEKNKRPEPKQEPSMFNMISLGLLATFAPTRIFLKIHKKHITDNVIVQPVKIEQIPIIYFHGFRGGDYTTKIMVTQALAAQNKKPTDFLKVTVDLLGNFKLEGVLTNDKHPIIQVVFRQRIVGIYATDYYLSFTLPFLAEKYHFKTYTAVAHSLGCPCIVRAEMKNGHKKGFPNMNKCACIAGPFDGVTYLGDIPNVNVLNEKGRPTLMNPHYLYLLFHRQRFNSQIAFLNIYGNVLNDTNTDRFISVVSAKSIRYILAPKAKLYQEIEIRGEEYAEHSIMHDNPFVINIINKFIGIDH